MHKETQPSQTQENLLTLLESIPNKQNHIQESIIPRMNKRRGREKPMSSEKVINNILGLPPEKPGEAYELIKGELYDKGFGLTPSLASEIADIIYYTSQPNCPNHLSDPSPLLNELEISRKMADSFCILKYEVRLKHGDQENHKQIENRALHIYLQSFNQTSG